MRMRMRTLFTAVAIGGSVAFAGTAQAATITHPDDYFFDSVETSLKLQNYESAFDDAWSNDPSDWNETGTIEVDDYLRGIFTISSSFGFGAPGDDRVDDGSFELTGEFSARVNRIDDAGGGDSLFELVPDADFEAEYGAGAMVAFYHDTSPDYTGTGSLTDSWSSAVDGDLYMVLGANGDWGEGYYWAARGSTTPSVSVFSASIALLENNTGLDSSLFLDVTQNPPSSGDGTFTNEAALGSIANEFALQGNTDPILNDPDDQIPWQISSQDPVRALVVPTPSAAVPALVLIGCLAMRRRSASRVA